jgi:diguanylate cyclase (GGDEF)-like protein
MIDEETGVLEKEFFDCLTRFEINRAMRYQNFATLLFLEPDQEFNNGMTLRTLARILKEEFRKTDIIGRVNHSQFGVILLHADSQRSFTAVQRLRSRIENYLFSENRKGTISLGGACFPNDSTSYKDLVFMAEQMLKTARTKGGNTICFPSKEEL